VEIRRIVAMEHDLESRMMKSHLRNHGVFEVAQTLLPIRPDPGELLVNPDPQAAEPAKDMIFLANMRVEQLPQGVVSIKRDQESAVTDGYVSGHDDCSWVKDRSKKIKYSCFVSHESDAMQRQFL
jgi:hypothetical protein